MDNRSWSSGASASPPSAPASPSMGYPTPGDPQTATPATKGGAFWFHQIGEELRAVLTAAGITPSTANNAQLLEAIQRLIDAQSGNYALDTGAANAYVVALSPAITAYTDGLTVRVKIANTNTGASTLNAGGGAVPWVNDVGGALAGGDLPAGGIATVTYITSANKFYTTSLVQSQGDTRYAALAGLATQVFSALTAAQFDNTTKAATTEFVKRASGAFSGIRQLTASAALSVNDAGKWVQFYGSTAGQTITLPLTSNANFLSYWIQNSGSVPVTIAAAGADAINKNVLGPYQSVSTFTLNPGSAVCLVCYGTDAATWVMWGYDLSDVFPASLGGNGYQKLPSGVIIQWGQMATSGAADVAITYPIAFPSAVYSVAGSVYNGAGSFSVLAAFGNMAGSLASIPVSAYYSNTAARSVQVVNWIAIGK